MHPGAIVTNVVAARQPCAATHEREDHTWGSPLVRCRNNVLNDRYRTGLGILCMHMSPLTCKRLATSPQEEWAVPHRGPSLNRVKCGRTHTGVPCGRSSRSLTASPGAFATARSSASTLVGELQQTAVRVRAHSVLTIEPLGVLPASNNPISFLRPCAETRPPTPCARRSCVFYRHCEEFYDEAILACMCVGRAAPSPYVLYCVHMQTAAKGAGGVVNELIGDAVRFPLWWYTTGMVYTVTSLLNSVRYYARSLGIAVWIRNIFVPMYGQYDWQSRIISVFMRSAQIVFRGFGVCIWVCIATIAFVAYVALPIVSVAFLLFHLTGGVFGIYG